MAVAKVTVIKINSESCLVCKIPCHGSDQKLTYPGIPSTPRAVDGLNGRLGSIFEMRSGPTFAALEMV